MMSACCAESLCVPDKLFCLSQTVCVFCFSLLESENARATEQDMLFNAELAAVPLSYKTTMQCIVAITACSTVR